MRERGKPEPPLEPADKASQAAPTESKKHVAAGARQSAGAEQAHLQQQLALQRSMESAQLSSSLENPKPNAVAVRLHKTGHRCRQHRAQILDIAGLRRLHRYRYRSSGAVVPNATVTLKNNSTGQTRNTTTNNNGAYRFSLLQPGAYTVTATATGFSKAETTATINVGQATVADVKLAVGSSSQTVEVTSAGLWSRPITPTCRPTSIRTLSPTPPTAARISLMLRRARQLTPAQAAGMSRACGVAEVWIGEFGPARRRQ